MPQHIFHWQDQHRKLSDRELIEKYRSTHNKDLVATLFGRYVELLYGLSLKHLRQSEESIDTVFEIFEVICEKLKNHDIDNFKSWLYRVACNYCIDKIRKSKMKRIDITSGHMQLIDVSFDLIDDMKEKEIILEKINTCLNELNPHQKMSIQMFFFEEKSYQHIAGALDITWDQTRSLIQNGKRNLKICMEAK